MYLIIIQILGNLNLFAGVFLILFFLFVMAIRVGKFGTSEEFAAENYWVRFDASWAGLIYKQQSADSAHSHFTSTRQLQN